MGVILVSADPDVVLEDSLEDGHYRMAAKVNVVVECDSLLDGPTTVLSDSRVPIIGSRYDISSIIPNEHNNFLVCVKRVPKRQATTPLWTVECSYETLNPNYNNVNPLLNFPFPEWDFVRFEEVADFDNSGNAVINSAGVPFNPPVTRDRIRPILRVTRNEQTFNPYLAQALIDSINVDEFLLSDPKTVKLSNITPVFKTDPNIGTYWAVTYEFEFKVGDTWKYEIRDQGLMQLGSSGAVVAILDANGQPVTEPQLLDGTGHAIPPGADAASSAVKLPFDIYNEYGFEELFAFANLDIGFGPNVG